MPTLEPYANNLVLEEFEMGGLSKGGLLIPQIAKASTPYRYAKVIAVGPGRYATGGELIPCSTKVGDIVAFAKNAGYEFPLEDENGDEKVFRMVSETFVMGRIHGFEQSLLTGLDGKLLRMNPNSRATPEVTDMTQEAIARATRNGFIDTTGDTLQTMAEMDQAEAESDS